MQQQLLQLPLLSYKQALQGTPHHPLAHLLALLLLLLLGQY
jgi:hypothetical protein